MGLSGSKKSENIPNSQRTQSFINSSSHNLGKNKFYSNDKSQSAGHRIQTVSPLKMPIPETFQCNQCGMMFSDDESLFKHRTRFCVGVTDSNIGRKLYYSDDEQINGYTNRSTLRQVIQHQSPTEKKRDEIYDWKNQRSILQSIQDMEDRIARDSQKTQRLANDLKKRTHDYNQILNEYERLQTQERDLLRQMFNLRGQSGSHLNHQNGLTDHERHQLESFQRQTTRLDQERRIIQTKLEEFIASEHQPSTILSNYEPYRLLRDMKEQQDYNERSLIFLRRRLVYPGSLMSSSSDRLSLPYVNPSRRTPADDVRSLRNGYLQSGGHDADILAHYSDLERRLYQYEHYPWMKGYPEPLKHYRYRPIPPIESPDNKLKLTKNENQRLQNELDDMHKKFQRLDSRTRQLELTLATSGAFDPKPNPQHSYPSSKVDRYPPINSLNHTSPRQTHSESYDQRGNHHQSTLPPIDRRITSHGTQSMNIVNSNISKTRDPLGPQPYDPVNGFVIFFDFILDLPPIIDQCQLITCLHFPQSGLGEPSKLQPFKAELYTNETSGEQICMALLATKQPVPGCPPEQALTIVIEIRTTRKDTPHEPLQTTAWTKVPLFDHKNRLLSGRWKIPIRSMPIRQDESLDVISTFPPFGRAELYCRLVNQQDAIEQTNAPLSPSFRDLYFYPPQFRNRPYM